jgi:hypothetical protein
MVWFRQGRGNVLVARRFCGTARDRDGVNAEWFVFGNAGTGDGAPPVGRREGVGMGEAG